MKPVIKDLGKVCITPEGDWDIKKEYANLSIVFNRNDAKVYISKQCVPIDIDILNTDYWHLLVDFDSIVNDMTALEIKNHVDNAIKEYIGNVPDEYNSLEKISNWIETLKTVNNTLSNNLEKEINNRVDSDNDIKNNSIAFGSFYANSKKNSVEISYNNINHEDEAKILIPAVTTENAGVMSAEDKVAFEKTAIADDFEFYASKDSVDLEIGAKSGNITNVKLPVATTENAGVMSAEDKNIIDTAPTELVKRIQGTSEKSSATNDPFKRHPTTFSSVTDAEFMEVLNIMHSTVSTSGIEGFWRLYIGRLAVEVKNVAIKYVDDIWVQTVKLPYKWYKSSNKFGIDDDGNYRIHTYYRIHKDGAWGKWIEVEEELKSAITAEENRAKAEEAAIHKLITDLIGESPEVLDSIHEISSWILNDQTGAAAIANAVSKNKIAIESEANRAIGAEADLAQETIEIRLLIDENIDAVKSKAVGVERFGVSEKDSSVDIVFAPVDSNSMKTVTISAATTEKAGVMSANDKTKVDTGFVGNTQTSELIKLNNYIQEGVFNFINVTFDNGSPISGNSVVSGRLTVFVTNDNDDKVITQVLNINNYQEGEGNIYSRSFNKYGWTYWAKLQTNIDVGKIKESQLNNLTNNGIYSGIIENTGETFIIICINNNTVGLETYEIAQLKYSLTLTHEVLIDKRIRNVDDSWSEWKSVGNGSTLPEATKDAIGGVKLGICYNNNCAPLVNINEKDGSGVGIMIDSSYFDQLNSYDLLRIRLNESMSLYNGIGVNLGINGNFQDVIPCVLGSDITDSSKYGINKVAVGIPYNSKQFCLNANGLNLVDGIGSGITKVTWNSSSNMNDFKTPGVYEIYGERTVKTDNLPIANDGSGHSISARLTVVASTLQPANNEICVTQFLMLSNRVGGDGNVYVRTYNQNNGGVTDGVWSPWQKQMGMVETLINSNETTVGQEIFSSTAPKIGQGLNGMIDNGMYSGIYIDNLNYTGTQSLYYLSAQPTFVETFVLIVINDYAASGKLNLPRHITQLKYAVDAVTGQSTVKKRVGTGNDSISWSDWEDIGGGSSLPDNINNTYTNLQIAPLKDFYSKSGSYYIVNWDLKNSLFTDHKGNGTYTLAQALESNIELKGAVYNYIKKFSPSFGDYTSAFIKIDQMYSKRNNYNKYGYFAEVVINKLNDVLASGKIFVTDNNDISYHILYETTKTTL